MTDYYVDSVQTGLTGAWVGASATMVALPATTSADTVYVSSRHVEAATGNLADSAWTGVALEEGGPLVISVTVNTTTYAAGAKINTTSGFVQFHNSGRYFGVTFEGSSGIQRSPALNEAQYTYQCTFSCPTADDIIFISNQGLTIDIDPTYQFEGSSGDNAGGFSLNAGDTTIINPTFANVGFKDNIFDTGVGNATLRIYGGDWSAWGSSGGGVNIASSAAGPVPFIYMYGCKLPGTYSINAGTTPVGTYPGELHLIGCDDDTSNDRYNYEYTHGALEFSTDDAVYLTSATDGFKPSDAPNNVSWRVDRVDSDHSRFNPGRLPPLVAYNTSTGATKTITVELLVQRTAATPTAPQDDEIFGYVIHHDQTTTVQATRTQLGALNVPQDTPSNLSAGTGLANWTGEPTNSASYKLEISAGLDVDREGPVTVLLFLGGFSDWDAIYINPKAIIS